MVKEVYAHENMVTNYNHSNLDMVQSSKQNGQYNGALAGHQTWINDASKVNGSKTSLQSNEGSEKLGINGFTSTDSIDEVEIKMVSIELLETDKRFGFSVVGGVDQGFPPRIEEISKASPAVRTDLQINDEIIDVNGIPVVDDSHAEVIRKIHECIQKRVINLRIRRYLDNFDGYEDSINGDEQGHFHNDGFTHEVCVDGDMNDADDVMTNKITFPIGKTNDGIAESFVNPAFDKDDISDEDLDSAMVQPSVHRQRTLPIPSFIAVVEHLKNKLLKPNEQEDVKILRNLFNSHEFQSAIRTHNDMTKIHARKKTSDDFKPVATNSQFLLSEVRHILLGQCDDDDNAEDLLNLINNPHIQSLLLAHDRLAVRHSLDVFEDDDSDENDKDSLDDDFPYMGEETVNVVRIDKTNEPLGATVKNEGDAVIISRIVKGGAAERSGLLHEGDEILEINNNPVKGKNVNEVVELLNELDGTLSFLLVSGKSSRKSPTREKRLFFRAQFDYDPQDDNYTPCHELGLPFRKGDILEILSQEDANWWQAKRLDEETNGLAGLIPSKTFQQQRESTKVTLREEKEPESVKKKRGCFCLRGKKKKTRAFDVNHTADFTVEEILTYEEMVQIDPDPGMKRPVVLIGPPKVGRRELRQKLISVESDRFAPVIPHTSRPPQTGEVDGQDYHFISQSTFQSDIEAHRFVEYGQYDNYYYGTSLDAIRAVVKSGKVCVLNLHCQALPVLKNSDLQPYVVFITLPCYEQLDRLRGTAGEPFNPNVRMKTDDVKDLIERARDMDRNYGHYFDSQIVNQNLEKAYEELLRLLNFIETQPQWVPVAWVD